MKCVACILVVVCLSVVSFDLFGQWNPTGFNYTTDRLAIGASGWSGKRLFVQGNDADHIALFENTGASGFGLWLRAANDPLRIVAYGSSNFLFVVNGTGNVGIGTSTPSSKLDVRGSYIHVVSAVNSYAFLARDSDPGNDSYLYHRISPNFHILGSNKNGTGTMRKLGFGLGGGDTELDVKMTIDNSGFVGIGTTNPSQKLEAAGSIFINSDNAAFAIDANGSAPRLGFLKKAGAYPVFAAAANVPMIFGQSNQTGLFTNIATSVVTERMRIDANGNVGIGSTAPSQKLTVNGTIYGKEVKVDLLVPGPDYVFSKTYSLRSLQDVEVYIEENQHLPEVPSAVEMEKDGIKLGEMNMLLLKKVEELTLYILDQEKRLKELELIIRNK